MLEELLTSRDLKEKIKEVDIRLQHIRWEDLPSWEIGLEKSKIIALYEVEFKLDEIANKYNDIEVRSIIKEFY